MMSLRHISVRYRILFLLVVLSFINYLLRNNLSVALPSIRQEFGFSTTELGWILGSFNFSYALFQLPGGIYGEAYGPRRAMAWLAVSWGVLTFLTGFAPALMAASAAGALTSLVIVRFLLGVTNAPLFPTMAVSIYSWFPRGQWAFPNSASSMGAVAAQAASGPVVTFLILHFGWRESFYALAPLGILCGAWWYWYGRDVPAEHRAITREEVELLARDGAVARSSVHGRGEWRKVLAQRNVMLLATSYFFTNYVFYMFANWLFTYLVESRGLSELESGYLYALPFATGAALAVVGGLSCDVLCRRYGARWGCRLPAMVALLLVAVFLLAGTYATHPYAAVGLLSLCFGFTQFVEGPFWAAVTYTAGPHAATAGGVMNTGGNLAGFFAPVVGFMVDQLGWVATLASGSIFAVVAATLWLFIDLEKKPAPHSPAAVVA